MNLACIIETTNIIMSLIGIGTLAFTILIYFLTRKQLRNANEKLLFQSEQMEIALKSKMGNYKSRLISLLQNLSLEMHNLPLRTLGGDFDNALFSNQSEIEKQIHILITELKLRTKNVAFTNLLDSINTMISSYWKIKDNPLKTEKSKMFEEYKKNLNKDIKKLENVTEI